jgi:hypothetical protein
MKRLYELFTAPADSRAKYSLDTALHEQIDFVSYAPPQIFGSNTDLKLAVDAPTDTSGESVVRLPPTAYDRIQR